MSILMKPILYSRIGLLDKLSGVSSEILLAFADCNRAIINIEIFKPKNLCEVSVWSGRQECFSVTLPNRHPRPKGHIRDISKTAFDVNFLRYQKYRRYIADVDF